MDGKNYFLMGILAAAAFAFAGAFKVPDPTSEVRYVPVNINPLAIPKELQPKQGFDLKKLQKMSFEVKAHPPIK